MRLNRTREREIAEILAANLGNPSRLPDTTANPSGLFAMSCCGGPVLVPVRIFITDFAFFFAAITADAARCCSANDNLIKCLVRRCFAQWNMERVKPERPNFSSLQLEQQEVGAGVGDAVRVKVSRNVGNASIAIGTVNLKTENMKEGMVLRLFVIV